MGDPFASTMVATLKIVDLMISLYNVKDENEVFLRLIERVYLDVQETTRERLAKYAVLRKKDPSKMEWIDTAIRQAKVSLSDIGQFLCGPDPENLGDVNMKHRVRWVYQNHAKFVSRQETLATCHRSVLACLEYLHRLQSDMESDVPKPPPPEILLPEDDDKYMEAIAFKRARSTRNPTAVPTPQNTTSTNTLPVEIRFENPLSAPPRSETPPPPYEHALQDIFDRPHSSLANPTHSGLVQDTYERPRSAADNYARNTPVYLTSQSAYADQQTFSTDKYFYDPSIDASRPYGSSFPTSITDGTRYTPSQATSSIPHHITIPGSNFNSNIPVDQPIHPDFADQCMLSSSSKPSYRPYRPGSRLHEPATPELPSPVARMSSSVFPVHDKYEETNKMPVLQRWESLPEVFLPSSTPLDRDSKVGSTDASRGGYEVGTGDMQRSITDARKSRMRLYSA